MVSRDSSTTACRNLIFSVSRNDSILIGRHAGSPSPRSCDCRSTALEPTVLGFNTDTEFIATPTLFEDTVAWRIIAGSAAAACELAHTPTDEHPDLVAAAAAKVRSLPADASPRFERRTIASVAHPCNLGNALCKAFTFRVSKGSDAGAGHGVDAAGQHDSARKYRLDDLAFDRRVIGSAAL
jgi:hypothetical protein